VEQRGFRRGDLVVAIDQRPGRKGCRGPVREHVNTYRGYIDQAQKLEASNPQEAIQQLTLAKNLNPNGPGNPAGRIANCSRQCRRRRRLRRQLRPSSRRIRARIFTKKVNKLLSDARQAEKDGKQQDALTAYADVLKLQPGSPEAQSSTDRIHRRSRAILRRRRAS